ncbi:MAG: hypothetical protein ABJA67_10815 [Chthonomonadales bacterium]
MNQLESKIRDNGFLGKLFLTADDKVVIGQSPNAPLYAAFALYILALVTQGQMHTSFTFGYRICLIVWSVAELGWGVNLFRRILGMIVLILEISGIFIH